MTTCPNPRRCLAPSHIHTLASSDPLVQAIRESIVEDWHEAGMYGRADFDPRWLDGLASVTAQAAAGGVFDYLDTADNVRQIGDGR